jgi:hypothetical protein
MKTKSAYQPPFTITPLILRHIADISEAVGRISAGRYRQSGVGVMSEKTVVHMAPPAGRVPHLMGDLFHWLRKAEYHPLVASSAFHYEFEFIHPFADGNGRMGRLWQTLILSRWNPLFLRIPVESLAYAHQQEYYDALQQSAQQGLVTPFLEFMLTMIRDAMPGSTPQVTPQVAPQVEQLLRLLSDAGPDGLSRKKLLEASSLRDRKSFANPRLTPALAAGLIAMTIPDKPNSRMQRYRITSNGKRMIK